MTWQRRFDRLLKAMTQGEPHKRPSKAEAEAKVKPASRSSTAE